MKTKQTGWLAMFAIIMSFSGSAFAQTADHGAGNGNDGLDTTGGPGGEVVVPVPDSFGQRGTLMVGGSPGTEQTDEVSIYYCKTDTQGNIAKYGCGDKNEKMKLNQSLSVRPGKYVIIYSGTIKFVKVVANQATVITLATIRVAPDTRPVVFNVFEDNTHPLMKKRLALSLFTNSENEIAEKENCTHPAAVNREMCGYFKSDKAEEFAKISRINSDGSISLWSFDGEGFGAGWFSYVVDPKPGQFLSVLPGVYGIEFKDTQTGEIYRQFGIVAK